MASVFVSMKSFNCERQKQFGLVKIGENLVFTIQGRVKDKNINMRFGVSIVLFFSLTFLSLQKKFY